MRGTTQNHIDGIDALRGLAATSVLIFHFELIGFGPENSPNWFTAAQMGVELFFIISGFVILLTLERSPSVTEFAVARFARLYPAYWLSVLVTAFYVLWVGKYGVTEVLVNATMLQTFFGVTNITNPYWSLALELTFYVGMMGLAKLGLLRQLDWLCIVWLVAMAGVRLAGLIQPAQDPLLWVLFMPQFGAFFVAGMMLYRFQSGRGTWLTGLALALAVLHALFGRDDWAHFSPALYSGVMLFCVALVWVAASGRMARIFTWPPLLALGHWSYSLYLLHCTVANLCVLAVVALGVPRLWSIAAALPISLAAAALSRRFVELPAQRWIKRKLRPKPALAQGEIELARA